MKTLKRLFRWHQSTNKPCSDMTGLISLTRLRQATEKWLGRPHPPWMHVQILPTARDSPTTTAKLGACASLQSQPSRSTPNLWGSRRHDAACLADTIDKHKTAFGWRLAKPTLSPITTRTGERNRMKNDNRNLLEPLPPPSLDLHPNPAHRVAFLDDDDHHP